MMSPTRSARASSVANRVISACALSVILALLLLHCNTPAFSQPVDAALSRDAAGCEDGVGSTYLSEELDAALDSDTYAGFMQRRAACGPDGILGYTLEARCAPGDEQAGSNMVGIFCSVTVWNPSQAILELRNDQFSLVSNAARYEVDAELIKGVVAEDTLTGGRRVYPRSVAGGVVGFLVPQDRENDVMVLVWHVPNAESASVKTWKRLQIILADREGIFVEPSTVSQHLQPDGSLRLSGETDLVSRPVNLPAGIYRVQARYRGESNFAVWVRTSTGDSDLLFNEIDSYNGEATFQLDDPAQVLFEVTGDGWWEIAVTPAFG